MGPDDQMMAPVECILRFMQSDEDEGLLDVFEAGGAVIVENFQPYLFEGLGAVARWRDGFRMRVREQMLQDLRAEFGPAQDFDYQRPDLVFFSLPTRWTGFSAGRAFDETGGWAFVLVRGGAQWKVRSYAWAVTSKT